MRGIGDASLLSGGDVRPLLLYRFERLAWKSAK